MRASDALGPHRWAVAQGWAAVHDGRYLRPVVAAVLALLLLGMPHHRLFIWLSDAAWVKYWKELLFGVGCLAYAAAVVAGRGLTRSELRGLLWVSPFVALVALRLVIGLLGGEDRHLVLVGGASQLFYVPVFLMTIYLLETTPRPSGAAVERALLWILAATALAALLSILDNVLRFSGDFGFFGRMRAEAKLDYDADVWRSSATYQSPMMLGMIVGTGFLLCLWRLVTAWRERSVPPVQLAAWGGGVLLHLVGLYLTFSRGPLVAAMGGAVVIGLFGGRGVDLRRLARNWRRVGAGLAGVAVVVAVVILLLPTPLQRHLGSIFSWEGGDQNNMTRLRKMAMGVEKVGEAPWLGSGLGTAQMRLWHYRFLTARNVEGLRGDALRAQYFFSNPESQFLSWAVEGGLSLLAAALLIVGFTLHTALALASHPGRQDLRRLGVLFLGLAIALYAEALIMPILDTRTFQLGFWALFGALVYYRGALDGVRADPAGDVGGARPVRAEVSP